MKRLFSTLFACFFTFISSAQITSRVQIDGKIDVPIGDEVEGVVVYNRSTNQGTITNAKGVFKIKVGINDRIEVVAMQYQHFIILIDKGVVHTKKLHIYLNESVNQLDEVVVTPYDLNGNVTADIKKIEITKSNLEAVTQETSVRINDADYDFEPDNVSQIRNNAFRENRIVNGLNFVNLFKLVYNNKKRKKEKSKDKYIDIGIREMYTDDFFKNFLALEADQINDFIVFAEDNGLDNNYFKNGKELDLLQFLAHQSKLYKKQ